MNGLCRICVGKQSFNFALVLVYQRVINVYHIYKSFLCLEIWLNLVFLFAQSMTDLFGDSLKKRKKRTRDKVSK